jgi:hypothetical protein
VGVQAAVIVVGLVCGFLSGALSDSD